MCVLFVGFEGNIPRNEERFVLWKTGRLIKE